MSPLTGLLEHLPGHREGKQAVQDIAASPGEDLRSMRKSDATLLSGRPVRWRFFQNTYWSPGLGLLAASVAAGLYFGIIEVHWYIHVGSFYQNLFYLKPGWDSLFPYGWWALYRHAAFRDLAEPAVASMAVKTVLAGRKNWGRPAASTLRIVTAPLVVILMIVALGIAGTWLINFGGPVIWAHVMSALGFPGFKVSAHFLGTLSVPQLAFGLLVMGPVVHRYWAPVGATLQGAAIDRSVDRRWKIIQRVQERTAITMDDVLAADAAGWHITPAWARLPLAPPPWRERFAYGWRNNSDVRERRSRRWAVILVSVVLVLVMLLGLAGHYWVGSLHHAIPYLAPNG